MYYALYKPDTKWYMASGTVKFWCSTHALQCGAAAALFGQRAACAQECSRDEGVSVFQ